MNKKVLLGIMLILVSLIIPLGVQAKEKVKIYLFEGSTCSHCAELKAFFGDLVSDEEYKDKFELQEYEIWHDTDNKELAEKVAEKMGDTLNGVPYYIIGTKSYSGFKSSDKDTIKKQIDTLYNDGYEDPVKEVIEEYENKPFSWTGIIFVGIVISILGAFIYFAQKE